MERKLIYLSLAVSLLIHFMTGSALWWIDRMPRPVSSQPVEITLVDPTTPQERGKTPLEKIGQIVEQSDQSLNDEVPEEAKFLSAHNQKVIKETKAAQVDKFTNKVAGGGGTPKKASAPSQTPAEKPQPKTSKIASSPLPGLEALKPQFAWKPQSPAASQEANQGSRPGPQADAGEASTPTTNDHLKETESGLQTLLNTREFVYYSYYKRIKSQISQYWEPKIKDKVAHMFRQGRTIASTGDRTTRLLIVLDKKGVLVAVKVLGASGVEDLDEAAVEAFREAAPFPNPPRGIVEEDGTIKIRWDFILEANAIPQGPPPRKYAGRRPPSL